MKVTPILFNGDMVRALLEGRKTQTRRSLKPPFDVHYNGVITKSRKNPWGGIERFSPYECPFGQVGDLLWVRESFQFGLCINDPVAYMATHKPSDLEEGHYDVVKWRPSIHMPRWASRLTLRITGIRVERLQDVSESDAISEGIKYHSEEYGYCGYGKYACMGPSHHTPIQSFQSLWESTGGKWDNNQWVWVIEFEVIHKNVDGVIKQECSHQTHCMDT